MRKGIQLHTQLAVLFAVVALGVGCSSSSSGGAGSCADLGGGWEISGSCTASSCTLAQSECSFELSCTDGAYAGSINGDGISFSGNGITCSGTLSGSSSASGTCTSGCSWSATRTGVGSGGAGGGPSLGTSCHTNGNGCSCDYSTDANLFVCNESNVVGQAFCCADSGWPSAYAQCTCGPQQGGCEDSPGSQYIQHSCFCGPDREDQLSACPSSLVGCCEFPDGKCQCHEEAVGTCVGGRVVAGCEADKYREQCPEGKTQVSSCSL